MGSFWLHLFGRPPEVDRTWHASGFGAGRLVSADAIRAPVTKMSFGHYGEIFAEFADGRQTCVWPSGDPVSPSRIRLSLSTPVGEV